MTRPPFLRWFGWSVAAHVALGVTVWILLPRLTPPNPSVSDAAVTVVALVDAPSDEPATEPTPPQRPSRPASSAAAPVDRSTPTPAPIMDDSFAEHVPDASLPALDSVQPDATPPPIDASPDPADEAISSPPNPAVPIQASEVQPSAGTSTDRYRPLVLAILERAKRYPLVAQHRGIEGTVEVAFLINPDGRLSDPELIASSNHRMLDEATLTMLRRVGILPPPPDREPIRFPARIQYQIDQ